MTRPEYRVIRVVATYWGRAVGRLCFVVAAVVIATISEMTVPVIFGRTIDILASPNPKRLPLVLTVALMPALGLLMLIFRHLATRSMISLSVSNMQDVLADGFAKVQKLSADWHTKTPSGSIVRQCTRGMWAIDSLNDIVFLALVPSVITLIGAAILLAVKWPVLGAVMLAFSIAYLVVTVVLALFIIAPAARLSNIWDSRVSGVIADAVGGNLIVRSVGAERLEERRLRGVLSKWGQRTARTWGYSNWAATVQGVVLWSLRSVLTLGVFVLWSRGAASTGEVVGVMAIYFVVHGYLRDVGQHLHTVQRGISELIEMVAIMDSKDCLADTPGVPATVPQRGCLSLRNVGFRYRGQTAPVFEDLNLEIPAGQRVGLVGSSGSGKSTLIKLILRFHEPDNGQILIDGQDISTLVEHDFRARLALVPQETILFNRSVAENIGYGRTENLDMGRIQTAALYAGIHEKIASLRRGYHTLVGERGGNLSGGERQKVAVARAFASNAKIMLFDEATSNLDAQSEVGIRHAIREISVGRTVLVVAHQILTVQDLDRILVIDNGRIIEDGTHHELLAFPDGAYAKMFELQRVRLSDLDN